jgi:ribonuclease HII
MILIDAVKLDLPYPSQSIIHGDALSYSIACASIVAKVSRDRYMTQIAQKYAVYDFEKHKGYPTKQHIEALRQYGACEIHRKTFVDKFVG